MDRIEYPGLCTGKVVQGKIGSILASQVAADSAGTGHVAILATADVGVVSPEASVGIDGTLSKCTLTPLPVCTFDGELIGGVVSRMRRVEIDQYVRASLTDVRRIGDVMAGPA